LGLGLNLLSGGNKAKQRKQPVDSIRGDQGLKVSAVYEILQQITTRENAETVESSTKNISPANLISLATADIEAGRRVGVWTLAPFPIPFTRTLDCLRRLPDGCPSYCPRSSKRPESEDLGSLHQNDGIPDNNITLDEPVHMTK
jgi:hypothetical protein